MTISNLKQVSTIKLPVTPQGVEVNDIQVLLSEQGKNSAFRALVFGGKSSLMIKAAQLAKMQALISRMKEQKRTFEANKLETSAKYLDLYDAANSAAIRLAVIHSIGEQTNAIELDFTATFNKGSTAAEIEQKASFARVSVEDVYALEQKNIMKQYAEAEAGQDLAAAMFYGADTLGSITNLDADGYECEGYQSQKQIYIRPEILLRAFTNSRDFLLGWTKPDYAELGLLAADIETLEKAVEKYEELTERANEQSRTNDEMSISSADMQAGGSK